MSLLDFGITLPNFPGAACANPNADPEMWFPDPSDRITTSHAKEACGGCPARLACLQWALAEDVSDGIWGGLTPQERGNLETRPTCTRCNRHPARPRSTYCAGCALELRRAREIRYRARVKAEAAAAGRPLSKGGRPLVTCRRCGLLRPVAARELCKSCHRAASNNGTLEAFPRSRWGKANR